MISLHVCRQGLTEFICGTTAMAVAAGVWTARQINTTQLAAASKLSELQGSLVHDPLRKI